MIIIAQEDKFFTNIRYLEDHKFTAYDLDTLEITKFDNSKDLQEFIASHSDDILQEVYAGIEILMLKPFPKGAVIPLAHNEMHAMEGTVYADWAYHTRVLKKKADDFGGFYAIDDGTSLEVDLTTNDFSMSYEINTKPSAMGYKIDFRVGSKQLIRDLDFYPSNELEQPLDEVYMLTVPVYENKDYALYLVSFDIVNTTLYTIFLRTPNGVLFADLDNNKFIPIDELSAQT